MRRLKHIFRNWCRRSRRIKVLPSICLNGERRPCTLFCVSPSEIIHNCDREISERDHRQEIFERFPEIRNQLWKGELWNHSYYVETVGSVSEEKYPQIYRTSE